MFAIERIKIIKDYLTKDKHVSVAKLSSLLNVTEVTIRRDLEKDSLARREYDAAIGKGRIPVARIAGKVIIRGDEPAKVYRAILDAGRVTGSDMPGQAQPMPSQAERLSPASAPPQEEFALP